MLEIPKLSDACIQLLYLRKTTQATLLLRLDGVVPLREMSLPLLLLLGDQAGLALGECAAHGAGLLGPEVEGKVLLLLVVQAQLVTLVGVDDGEDAGDRFADVVAVTITRSVYVISSLAET